MAIAQRTYSPEFKREALALVTAERRQGDCRDWVMSAKKLRSRQQSVKRSSAAERAAAGPVDPAAYHAALQRIAELERENEFLGKVSAFFASRTR